MAWFVRYQLLPLEGLSERLRRKQAVAASRAAAGCRVADDNPRLGDDGTAQRPRERVGEGPAVPKGRFPARRRSGQTHPLLLVRRFRKFDQHGSQPELRAVHMKPAVSNLAW